VREGDRTAAALTAAILLMVALSAWTGLR
jgi:hypothetical protein